MSTPSEIVTEQFANANSYAATFIAQAESFIEALESQLFITPTVSVTFAPVEAPDAVVIPDRPAALDAIEGEFDWDSDGSIEAAKPTALSVDPPSITISDFDEEAPELDLSGQPVLDFGTKPTITIGDVPTVPEVAEVTVPDAPTLDEVEVPTLLALSTPTFSGVDLRADFLEALEDVPTLDLVAPTPYTYTPGPEYESALLTALKSTLATRLAGGTGLDETVEAAIWDRARDRDAAAAAANLAEAEAGNEALGWNLPTGAMTASVRRARENLYNRQGDFAREVAIKQADLEQANLREAVQQGIQLEGNLITYSLELERLSFQSAVEVARNAIEVHTRQVEAFKAQLESTKVLAAVYDSIIKGELAKVEIYKAELLAEQTKADVNRAAVEQYKAMVEAGLSVVRLYEAQVQGARARMELESAKVSAAGERIKGFIAQVNGETAKLEAYKTEVSAEATKAQAWRDQVHGQLGLVDVYKAKAGAFAAKTSAQGDKARAELARFTALVQSKADEWRAWQARVDGERARISAVGQKADAVLAGYKAELQGVIAQSEQDISRWQTQIKEYEAIQNYTLQGQKLNAEIVRANSQNLLDAAKTGAQVLAQLTASALGRIGVSAGVSASGGTSVSYSYSNQTDSEPPSVTTV